MARRDDWRNLPNRITIARLGIAMVLFLMLSMEIQLGNWGLGSRQVVLNIAWIIFVVCVATDVLDGWLARRYGLVTTFGRIADPFVDKVVVCGTFIYLVHLSPAIVKPWFAVIIIAREFLITSLRGYLESQGKPFGARWGGKVKMLVQSVAIPTVLCYEANFAVASPTHAATKAFYWASVILITVTLIATLVSAWDYLSLCFAGSPETESEPTPEGRR